MGFYDLLGIFLLTMGVGMLAMGFTLKKTNNVSLSWMVFGIIYTVGIIGVLGNSHLKSWLNISEQGKSLFSIYSIIILAAGIMLSFVFGSKKGERTIILGILFTVGIHFLPFNNEFTYILAAGVAANSAIAFWKTQTSIYVTIGIDALLKITMGVFLFLL